jgi:hypothetical protein
MGRTEPGQALYLADAATADDRLPYVAAAEAARFGALLGPRSYDAPQLSQPDGVEWVVETGGNHVPCLPYVPGRAGPNSCPGINARLGSTWRVGWWRIPGWGFPGWLQSRFRRPWIQPWLRRAALRLQPRLCWTAFRLQSWLRQSPVWLFGASRLCRARLRRATFLVVGAPATLVVGTATTAVVGVGASPLVKGMT